MKKKLLLLSVLTLLLSTSIWAYDFSAENDDGVTIYYNITSSDNKTVEVTYGGTSNSSALYLGDVVIPETITYSGTTYSVTSIGEFAFYKCGYMTSVTIPNSVTLIDYAAFGDCRGLTEINIPESVTKIGGWAFYYCSALTDINIPEGVTSIGDLTFYCCSALTDINIPESVTSIGKWAFSGCGSLTEITIPAKVTKIGEWAFDSCRGLTKVNFNATACTSAGSAEYPVFYYSSVSTVNFGDNVTRIPSCLCYGLTGLAKVTIPESVTTIGDRAFYGCSGLTEVNFNAIACTSAGSSTSNYAFNDCTKLSAINLGDNATIISDYLFCNCTWLNEITIPESVTKIGGSAFYGCTGLTEISIPESVTSIGNDAFGKCSGLWSINNTSKTQATCTMKLTNSNISGAESGIVRDNTFYPIDEDGYCTITNLVPDNSYSYYLGVKLSNGSFSRHGDSKDVTTASANLRITQVGITPDTYTATGSYTEGDAVVTETGFTGYTTDGVTLYLSNLVPETEYTVEYYVKVSGSKVTTSTTFTTPAVEFTTLPAKATSNTVARIAATTNLSDDAVGAGFEWRRNDAPSTMPSSQAECPVIDGELTGTLNGLSSDTYYDFRPYYTSQGGTTYYGDWMTLLTADAYVYFEPTVRTYSATSVSSSSATVRAYAVAGSDDITSQGFEYWEGGSSSAMNVKRASTTDENGVTRVEVSGQWMTATFEDLEPSTTYSYRAYVTTAVGTTYGETMSFTTDVPTGIEETMLTEDAEVHEIARYTLDGKKVSQPQRGINIIRYSDGTVKKVLVK